MKHFYTFLALLLVLGCLAGCGSAQQEKTPDVSETNVSESNDPDICTYTVCCYSEKNHKDIEGVVINFCTDTACTPVTSSEKGTAVFTGPPTRYHVQIVKIPDGWELAQDEAEWYTEPFDETYRIPFAEVEQ